MNVAQPGAQEYYEKKIVEFEKLNPFAPNNRPPRDQREQRERQFSEFLLKIKQRQINLQISEAQDFIRTLKKHLPGILQNTKKGVHPESQMIRYEDLPNRLHHKIRSNILEIMHIEYQDAESSTPLLRPLLTCIREDNEECSIKAHKIFRKILIKLFKHYKEVNSQTQNPTPPSEDVQIICKDYCNFVIESFEHIKTPNAINNLINTDPNIYRRSLGIDQDVMEDSRLLRSSQNSLRLIQDVAFIKEVFMQNFVDPIQHKKRWSDLVDKVLSVQIETPTFELTGPNSAFQDFIFLRFQLLKIYPIVKKELCSDFAQQHLELFLETLMWMMSLSDLITKSTRLEIFSFFEASILDIKKLRSHRQILQKLLQLCLTASQNGSLDWLTPDIYTFERPLFNIKLLSDDKHKQCRYHFKAFLFLFLTNFQLESEKPDERLIEEVIRVLLRILINSDYALIPKSKCLAIFWRYQDEEHQTGEENTTRRNRKLSYMIETYISSWKVKAELYKLYLDFVLNYNLNLAFMLGASVLHHTGPESSRFTPVQRPDSEYAEVKAELFNIVSNIAISMKQIVLIDLEYYNKSSKEDRLVQVFYEGDVERLADGFLLALSSLNQLIRQNEESGKQVASIIQSLFEALFLMRPRIFEFVWKRMVGPFLQNVVIEYNILVQDYNLMNKWIYLEFLDQNNSQSRHVTQFLDILFQFLLGQLPNFRGTRPERQEYFRVLFKRYKHKINESELKHFYEEAFIYALKSLFAKNYRWIISADEQYARKFAGYIRYFLLRCINCANHTGQMSVFLYMLKVIFRSEMFSTIYSVPVNDPRRNQVFIQKLISILDPLLLPLMRCLLTFMEDQQNMLQRDLPELIMNLAICRSERILEFGPFLRKCLPSLLGNSPQSLQQVDNIINKLTRPLQYFERQEIFAYLSLLEGNGPMFTAKLIDSTVSHASHQNLEYYFSKLGAHVRSLIEQKPLRPHSRSEEGLLVLLKNEYTGFAEVLQLSEIIDSSFKALLEQHKLFTPFQDNFITLTLFIFLPAPRIDQAYIRKRVQEISEKAKSARPYHQPAEPEFNCSHLPENQVLQGFVQKFLKLQPQSFSCKTVSLQHFEAMSRIFTKFTRLLIILSMRDNQEKAREWTTSLIEYLALVFVTKDGSLKSLVPNEADPLGFFIPAFDFIFSDTNSNQNIAVQRKELDSYGELTGRFDTLSMGLFVIVKIVTTCKKVLPDPNVVGHLEIIKLIVSQLINHVFQKEKDNRYQDALFVVFEVLIHHLPGAALRMHQRSFIAGLKSLLQSGVSLTHHEPRQVLRAFYKKAYFSTPKLHFYDESKYGPWPSIGCSYLLVSVEDPTLQTEEEEYALVSQLFHSFDESITLLMEGYLDLKPETGGKLLRRFLGQLHQDRGINLIELVSLNRLHIFFNPHGTSVDQDTLKNVTLKRPPIRKGDSSKPSISMLIFEEIIAHSFRELMRIPAQTSKLIHYLDTLEFFIHVPLLQVTLNGSITPVFMVLLKELLDILKDDYFMYERAISHLQDRYSLGHTDSILPLYERMEDQLVAQAPFCDHHVNTLYYSDLFGFQNLEALHRMHLKKKSSPIEPEAPYLHLNPKLDAVAAQALQVQAQQDTTVKDYETIIRENTDVNPDGLRFLTLQEQVDKCDFNQQNYMQERFEEVMSLETSDCSYHGYHNIDKYLYQSFQLHAQHVRKIAAVLSLLMRVLTHKDIISKIKEVESIQTRCIKEDNLLYTHKLGLFLMVNMFKRVEKILVKAGKNVFRLMEQRFQHTARSEQFEDLHFIQNQLDKLPIKKNILDKVGRGIFGMRVQRRFFQISVHGISLDDLVDEMQICRNNLTEQESGTDFKQHIAKLRELWMIIPAIYKKASELKQMQKSIPSSQAFLKLSQRYIPHDQILANLINGVVEVGFKLYQDGFLFGILDNKLQTGQKGTLGFAFIKACAAMGQDFAKEALWNRHDLLPILAKAMKMSEAYELRERISRSLPMILEQSIESIDRDRQELENKIKELGTDLTYEQQELKRNEQRNFEKSQLMLVRVIQELVFAAPHWFAEYEDLDKKIGSLIRITKNQFREKRENPSHYEICTAQILINCMMLVLECSRNPHPANLFTILKLANVLPLFEISKLPDFIDKRATTSGIFLRKTFLYFLHLVEDKHGTSYEELFILLNFGVLPIFKRFLLNIETESAKDPNSSSYYKQFNYESEIKKTMSVIQENPRARQNFLFNQNYMQPTENLSKMLAVLDQFSKGLVKPPLNLLLQALDKRQSILENEENVESVPQYLTHWQLRSALFQILNVIFTLQYRVKRWESQNKEIESVSRYFTKLAQICRHFCNREVRDAILLLEGRFHMQFNDFKRVPGLEILLGRLIKLLMVKNRGDPDLWADTLSKFLTFIVCQFFKEGEHAQSLEEPQRQQEKERIKSLKNRMSNDLVLALWQLMERSSKTFPHHKKFIENCQEYYYFAVNQNMIRYFEQIIARLYLRAEKDYEIHFAILAIDFSRILSLWMLRWQREPNHEGELKSALKAIKLEQEVRRTCFIFLSEKQGQEINTFLQKQVSKKDNPDVANTPMLDLPDFKLKECIIYYTKRPRVEEYTIKMAQHIANVLEVRRRAGLHEPFKFKEVMIYIESAHINLKQLNPSFMILFAQFLCHLLEYLVRELKPEFLHQSHLEILRLLKIIIGNGESYFLVEIACKLIHNTFLNKMKRYAPQLIKLPNPEKLIEDDYYKQSWKIMEEDFDVTQGHLGELGGRFPLPQIQYLKRLLPLFSVSLHRQFKVSGILPQFQQIMLRCLRMLIQLKMMSIDNYRKTGQKDRFLPPVEPLNWNKYVAKQKYLSFEFTRLLPCAYEEPEIGINKVYSTLVSAIQIMNLQLQNMQHLHPEQREDVFNIFANMLDVLNSDSVLEQMVGLTAIGQQVQVLNSPARLETKIRLLHILVQRINKMENKFAYKTFIDRVFMEIYNFQKHVAVFSESHTELLQEIVFNHLGIEHQRRRIEILTTCALGKTLYKRMRFIVGRWVTDKLESRPSEVWLFASTMILLGAYEVKPLEPDIFFNKEQPIDTLCFSTLRSIEDPQNKPSTHIHRTQLGSTAPLDYIKELVLKCQGFLSNKGRAYLTNSWLMAIGTVTQISMGQAQRLFLRIFPISWNGLSRSEQNLVVADIELFIRRVIEMKPQLTETCIVPLLEACARCSPQINLDPMQLHSLTRSCKIWHLVIPLLQAAFLRHPAHELYYVTLTHLYEETKDKDSIAAIQRLMSNVPETKQGVSLAQNDLHLQAAECFYGAIKKYISTMNTFTHFGPADDSQATGPAGTYNSGYESAGSQSHMSDDSYATFHDGEMTELNERFEDSLRLSLDQAQSRDGERRQLPRQVDMRTWEQSYIKAVSALDNWNELEEIAQDSGSELLLLEIAMNTENWERAAEINHAISNSSVAISHIPEFFQGVRKAVQALGQQRNRDQDSTEPVKPDSGTVMDDEKQAQLLKLLKQEYSPITLEQLLKFKSLNSKQLSTTALANLNLHFELKEGLCYLRNLTETLFKAEAKLKNESLAKLFACWRDRTLVPGQIFAKQAYPLFKKRITFHNTCLGFMNETIDHFQILRGQHQSISVKEKNNPEIFRQFSVKEARLRVLQQRIWGSLTVAGVQRKRKNYEGALTQLLEVEEGLRMIQDKCEEPAIANVLPYELYRLAKEQLKLSFVLESDDLLKTGFARSAEAIYSKTITPPNRADLLRARAISIWKRKGHSAKVETSLVNSAFADQTSPKAWGSLAKYYREAIEKNPANVKAISEYAFALGRTMQFAPKTHQQMVSVQLFLFFSDQTAFQNPDTFSAHDQATVKEAMYRCLGMVPVWSWLFWIPQLLQRLYCKDLTQDSFEITEAILHKLASLYPQALFPLLHGELNKIAEQEREGKVSNVSQRVKEAMMRLDSKIKREQNRNIHEINKLQQLLVLLHQTLKRSPEETLDSELKIALSDLADLALSKQTDRHSFMSLYRIHLDKIGRLIKAIPPGSMQVSASQFSLENESILALFDSLTTADIETQSEAVEVILKLKQLSDLMHNLVAMNPRSLFVKERNHQLLSLNLRNIERFLLLYQLVQPSIDRRQYFSRIFTELRQESQHHHYEVHFEVNNSYDLQLLHRDFDSIRYDQRILNAMYLKQLCDLIKTQIFPRFPATYQRSLNYIQCNFLLSYPFSLSRQDISQGLSLRTVSNQILTERGYDVNTALLLKTRDLKDTVLVKQMNQGPFPKSALTEFLQRSFHVINSDQVFVFKRRFSCSWGAQSFLSYVLQMSKRDLDNVVLLVNKCNLTTRYPYFTLNDLDVFINKEAVPFRYSQSFKYYFGRLGREGTIPGTMTAASLSMRNFERKAKDMLSLFFLSVYQNLSQSSKYAVQKGTENANVALKRALSLSGGVDLEEDGDMLEADFTNRSHKEFNTRVYDLLLQASMEQNYQKMPLSWAPWL